MALYPQCLNDLLFIGYILNTGMAEPNATHPPSKPNGDLWRLFCVNPYIVATTKSTVYRAVLCTVHSGAQYAWQRVIWGHGAESIRLWRHRPHSEAVGRWAPSFPGVEASPVGEPDTCVW